MSAKLKLSGRSGCEIMLIENGSLPVVRKYSKDFAYNSRLVAQANKQATYVTQAMPFCTPGILSSFPGDKSQLAWIEMEYVHAEKYSDYLEYVSVPRIKELASSFYEYFVEGLRRAPLQRIPPEVFLNKLQSLKEIATSSDRFDMRLLAEVFCFLDKTPSQKINFGFCHGDFTFSNLLFDERKIYLIDFLDSFVETPIQDIVKYRQDTRYGWSLMLERELPLYKRNKLKLVMAYLDQSAQSVIDDFESVRVWYQYLQVFNLLRILPYLSDSFEIRFVEDALRETL